MIGTVSETALIDFEPDFAIKNIGLIKTAGNYELAKWIYYYLKSSEAKAEIDALLKGSTQSYISLGDLRAFPIKLPPESKRFGIVSVLSSLDNKIDLLHRQNKTLEAMAEALFRQWFIEEAEDDWKEVSLKDIVELQSGFPFRSPSFTESGIYQIITIKAVQDGYLDLSNADRVKEVPDRMPSYCFLGIGDILLSLTGNVGRCCIVDSQGLLLNQRVAKIKPKSNFYKAFVYTYFRRYETKLQLTEMAKGTAQLNLSPIETSNIKIKLPPIQTLTMFNDIASPCFDRIVANKLVIRNITKLRDSILPKLMSGEVKVELE
jgi:type I restriction enzyme S subunit